MALALANPSFLFERGVYVSVSSHAKSNCRNARRFRWVSLGCTRTVSGKVSKVKHAACSENKNGTEKETQGKKIDTYVTLNCNVRKISASRIVFL